LQDDNWGGEAGEDKGQEGVAEEDEGHASSSQKDSKMAAPAQNQVGKQEPRERKKPGKTDDSHILGTSIFRMLETSFNCLMEIR
jgi:hypothetical protein